MPEATVSSKGQLTIPKEVRDDLGIGTGTKVMFVRMRTGQYFLTAKRHSVMDLRGSVPYDGPPVTIEQMDEAVGAYLAEDDERIKREWREWQEGRS